MRLISKCFAVAMSALFALTPVTPAGAVPMSAAKVQQTGSETNVQLVQDNQSAIYRNRDGRRGWRDGRRGWRGDREYHRGWRGERRWSRNRDWRGDRGYRRGWDRGERHGWYRGHRGYRYARRGYRHHNGYWFPLAAFGAGAIIGGAIANDRGYVGGGGSHVNWCANRYRSYRAYDNTFQPYGGPRRQCISPYR